MSTMLTRTPSTPFNPPAALKQSAPDGRGNRSRPPSSTGGPVAVTTDAEWPGEPPRSPRYLVPDQKNTGNDAPGSEYWIG